MEGKRIVVIVDDVAKPLGIENVELYSLGAIAVTIVVTTSEGLPRKLVARHSYARIFQLWNLSLEATKQLLEALGAPRDLFDVV